MEEMTPISPASTHHSQSQSPSKQEATTGSAECVALGVLGANWSHWADTGPKEGITVTAAGFATGPLQTPIITKREQYTTAVALLSLSFFVMLPLEALFHFSIINFKRCI